MTLAAEVVFPLPIERVFLYLVPEHWEGQARIGSRVLVPFGEKRLTGFIIGLKDESPKTDLTLKEIQEVLDEEPALSPQILSFTRALSEYYHSSWGEVLQSSLPPSFILRARSRITLSEAGKESLKRDTLSPEEKNLAVLLGEKSYSLLYLKRKSLLPNVSSQVSRMRKKGLLQIREDLERGSRRKETQAPRVLRQLELDFFLDSRERRIIETIVQAVGQQAAFPFLLFGDDARREVIYFALIQRILSLSGKALFLVPEIALTSVLREEFDKRYGQRMAVLHSQMTKKTRELEWRRIRNGSVDIVVGPRSALFSPLTGLKLIIIDQEQDESYYQRENPVFDARRGAWLRARQENAVCVLGSERPSVESFFHAQKGGSLICLEHEKRKARVVIIDDRKERDLVGRPLKARIAAKIRWQEPLLLFLNRRGYSSAIFCPKCDYTPRCDRCDITLSYHKRMERLICHYCNFSIPVLRVCPRCGSSLIKKRGAGVEAVEEEVRRFFPKTRVAIFDSDVVKSQADREKVLEKFRRGAIPVLIGTQLLAHQTALPPVSLVGILYPEATLGLSDYRAGQKTFQSVSSMMEFARNDALAEIVIQTAAPDHFSIVHAAAGDYVGFYAQEIKFRELMDYPPFTHVAEILFIGENLRNLAQKIRDCCARLQDGNSGVEVLGPALAPVPRVRDVNRIQVTLKAKRREALDEVIKEVKARFKGKKTLYLSD